MLLVERLVGALSPEEIGRIQKIKLSPLEQRVLDTIISLHIYTKIGVEASTEQLRQELGMSDGNLRFYSSILLRKAYEVLVPAGGIPLLRMLAVRGLIHNFKNEIREQEKNLSPEQAREFYFAVFELSTGIVYSNLDLKICRQLGEKYLAALPEKSNGDIVAVDLRVKQAEFLQRYTLKRHRRRTLWEFRQYLDEVPVRLNGTDNRYARYAHADAECYYQLMTDPSATVRDRLTMLMDLLPPEMAEQLPETRDMLQYRLLQQYEQEDDLERIYQVLEDFFSTDRQDLPIRHHLQYAYYALLTARFDHAATLLADLAPKVVTKPPTTNTISYYQVIAVHHMLTDQLDKAHHALEEAAKAHRLISKHPIYEVYQRNLEVAYQGMKGDCEFCLRLIDRNLDWLRKGRHDIDDDWATTAHLIIREMITAFLADEEPNPKVMTRIKRYKKTGPDGLILVIINKLTEICHQKRSRSV